MKMIPPKFTLKDWSVEERPREKLISLGAQQLSNAELLALLIGKWKSWGNCCSTHAAPHGFP